MHSADLRASATPIRLAAALAAALLFFGHGASAHGGFFRADELRVDPANADHLLVRSDVWGIVESNDGGKTWQWTCAAAVYGDDLTVLREPLAMLPGGGVIMGSARYGIVRSKGASLCDWEVVPFFSSPDCDPSRCRPYDLAQEAPGSSTVIVLTTAPSASSGTFVSDLWRSADAGDTWTTMNAALPDDVFPIGVAVAPSDPSIVYVGSSDASTAPVLFLHHSTDGGQTFEQATLPFTLGPTDPSVRLRFYGVHPTDPRAVFLWLDADASDPNGKAPDRLFVSFDGGATISPAFLATNDLPGFAISKDGETVFLGGTDDGLWSASMADLRSGSADAFKRVNSGNTWALALTDRGLFAGREEFRVEAGTERMTLGFSNDLGVTFESAMAICDVAPADCAKGTRAGDMCPGLYYGDGNFQFDQQLRRCASDPKPPVDAGARTPATPASPKSDGCGCRTTVTIPHGSASAAGLFCTVLAMLRRSRGARGARSRRTSRRRD